MTQPAELRLIPNREARQIAARAVALGWRLARTKRHYVLHAPSGDRVVFSGTRVGYRELINFRAELRRCGCAL